MKQKQEAAFDIHNQLKGHERALRLIDQAQIGLRDQELLTKFLHDEGAGGIGVMRQTKYAGDLLKIRGWLGKNFEAAGEEDFKELVNAHIENGKSKHGGPYAAWTRRDFKICMVVFYRWLENERVKKENEKRAKKRQKPLPLLKKGRPPELEFMDLRMKERDHKLPESLLSEDELKSLIRAAANPKEKAFVAVLAESGCRVGEFLCIRLRDVSFDKNGAIVQVSGKTGARRVRLIGSSPYLLDYIQNYHASGKPEAPLWPSLRSGNTRPICYQAACKILTRIAAAAGVKKATNPHNFRHSRATELAKYLTEQQLKAVLGWTGGSDMPATYVHLSGQDTDDALLGAAGMRTREEAQVPKIKSCPMCRTPNASEALNCINKECGVLLDAMAWNMEREKQRERFELLMETVLAHKEEIAALRKEMQKKT